jgi:hypothetical protein
VFGSRQAGERSVTNASTPPMVVTQPLMRRISGVLSPGVNRPGRDVDHLHLVALARMSGTYPFLPSREVIMV